MKFCTLNSQRGFSALGIFIAGLAVIVLMGSTGFFQGPKSSTGEENVSYTVADQQSSNTKGLQMTKVNFSTPTPVPPTPTPVPSAGCFADSCQPVGDECTCPDLHLTCENGKCVKVDLDKSGSAFKTYTCAQVDQNGWCSICPGGMNGTFCIGKPVIYLYPEQPILVDVKVTPEENIFVSDPHYPTCGWKNVLAHPNGTLVYQNKQYRELFYESNTQTINRPKTGVIIDKQNLKTELLDFIEKLGLTRKDEQQEFLDWWTPKLQTLKTDRIFVSVLEKDEKARVDNVSISPKPDTFIQFIVYFAPLLDNETVKPLVLPEAPKRVGFTAIEWGGVVDTDPTN